MVKGSSPLVDASRLLRRLLARNQQYFLSIATEGPTVSASGCAPNEPAPQVDIPILAERGSTDNTFDFHVERGKRTTNVTPIS